MSTSDSLPVPTKFRLLRTSPDIDASVGHHTIEVSVQEVTMTPSPVLMDQGETEKYGISAAELIAKFGGDVEKWLAWVGQDMLQKHNQRVGIQTSLLQLHNTSVDIK